MARKETTLQVQDLDDNRIDQPAVAGAMAALRDQAQEDQAELMELAMGIGAIQAFGLVKNLTGAAQVKLFKRIRESKQINNLPIRGKDGQVNYFTTMREACPELFGRTYESMLNAEEKFDTFGQDIYESASRLRLNDAALRATRALPPEKLELVRSAIASGSTKAEVLSVIEDLAEKVQQAEAATAEAQAELKASEAVVATKNTRIGKLERELARIEQLPPDAQAVDLMDKVQERTKEATAVLRGDVRASVQALMQHHERHRSEPVRIAAAGLVGALMAELAMLRDEFHLADVTASGQPEWERWAAAPAAAAAAAAVALAD